MAAIGFYLLMLVVVRIKFDDRWPMGRRATYAYGVVAFAGSALLSASVATTLWRYMP